MRRKNVMANNEERENDFPISRSAKKRNCIALQKLGEELASLSPEERKDLHLPEELAEELEMLDRMGDKEAKRRQRQYIGRLMRDMDIAEIAKAMASRRNLHQAQCGIFQKAEKLRNDLVGAGKDERERIIKKMLEEKGNASDYERVNHLMEMAEKAASERARGERRGAFRNLFGEIAALVS